MESDLNTPVFNDSANEKTSADEIPFEQAMQVFDQLADRTDIAFAYAEDGCYARAHLMCLIINALGLTPKKAWAFEDRDYLSVQKPNGEKVIWGWHVTAGDSGARRTGFRGERENDSGVKTNRIPG